MQDLKSLSYEELLKNITDLNEPGYRAEQIFGWLHKKMVSGFDEMLNVPASLRNRMKESFSFTGLTIADVLESKKDGTKKFLFRLEDGNVIESVFMRYEHGCSVCISSQVGCAMGCRFCASGIGGKVRDLKAGEMLEQIYHISKNENERISNVVVMGTGEPFDNFDNFCRFYELLTDKRGLGLSGRNVTVSTCGIVEKIYELAEKGYPLTLAISLHAPNDELRRSMMPIARKYSISDIIKACDDYFAVTGRRVTYEYSLAEGVNDTPECADELSGLLAGKNCHVNLIPVNPVEGKGFERADIRRITAFKNILEKNGINATIRRGMGGDIDAACGQLRRKYISGG
ncbi:MAG: 23S rRNA (adenine(2503)-C(2))-methyltransferase RlmN [Lachnospiraceae bacterium]|nr:23S rRNA (adenine(2503)-C(2))-methyltransferase RlmN [Lachnospiraceae bacterium]